MGGATGGVWGYTQPPLLWPVPHRGYNVAIHIRLQHLEILLENVSKTAAGVDI